jgi:hypothetical protein
MALCEVGCEDEHCHEVVDVLMVQVFQGELHSCQVVKEFQCSYRWRRHAAVSHARCCNK